MAVYRASNMRGGSTEHGPAWTYGLGEVKSGHVYSVKTEGFILVPITCSGPLHNQNYYPDDHFAY